VIRFYRGLRRDVSLLLSEGHAHARRYPVAVAWSEANIVRKRNANRRVVDAVVSQLVLASNSGSKKAGKELQKLLEKVADSD
jgi:hypothetical protein